MSEIISFVLGFIIGALLALKFALLLIAEGKKEPQAQKGAERDE